MLCGNNQNYHLWAEVGQKKETTQDAVTLNNIKGTVPTM
jgi:hypothetical protein